MNSERRTTKLLWLLPVVVLITITYVYRLGFPSEPYYDEVHYAKFFHTLIHQHKYDYVSSHPPLWHLLTLANISVFGEGPISGRLVSVGAGLFLLVGIYWLAKDIFKTQRAAWLTVFFSFADGVSLTQARIGMLNSLTLLFMTLALYVFVEYFWIERLPRRRALLWTGSFLGLALSTKLAALGMFLMIYVLVLILLIKKPKERAPLFCESLLFLGILPLGIYALINCYILFLPGYSLKDVLKIQVFNWRYHTVEAARQTHEYMSQWWGWPLLLRPNRFYYSDAQGISSGIICIGNPVMFWMIPFMIVFLVWNGIARKDRRSGFILLGFLSQWLFYALGRRLKFFQYIYFAMPFVAMGLAQMSLECWEKGTAGRWLVVFYLVSTLGMFIYWYPLLTGLPVPQWFYQNHLWFDSWI